jgi:predicted glycogen debranching enzyme
MLSKGKSIVGNFSEAIQHEWLETNGLGGWASSSIIGCNTRRYHGLLVAATKPPAERMALVSKLDETIVVNDKRIELGTNQYRDHIIYPNGHEYIEQFSKDLFPQWIYKVNGIELRKTIAMVHGENTTVVLYEVVKALQSFHLELLPLLSVRGYHSLMHTNNAANHEVDFSYNTLTAKIYNDTPAVYIHVPGREYYHHPNWFFHFNYTVEQYRGLDYEEDLFNPGHFSVELREGDTIGIILSTEDTAGRNAVELLQQEEKRRKELIKDENNKTIQQLLLAADQFIVKRGADLKTVIAGYHWFTDWGRDTMIALPGLCLTTGRYEDAKKILSVFAQTVSMGMLPNRFQDNNEPPEYNNVDGTLWYFVSIHQYLQATGDNNFVLNELLPVLKDIIDWHFKGTRYNIHIAEDGLLYAGEKGQQLTWMDARIGNWVVTPRMGKPVEIQALWYNALKIFAELLRMNQQQNDADLVELSAAKAKQSFEQLFWYAQGGYLYDVLDEQGYADATLRPNQLLAVSLPFSLLGDDKARSILKVIEEQLYTTVGLRSLPVNDEQYVHNYGGDAWHRDASYHQGTVWSWLLGPYVDTLIKVKAEKEKIKGVIDAFAYHLNEGCIGSVAEIFDADAPHHPRGCIAQAWGVAEWLRVMKKFEYSQTE